MDKDLHSFVRVDFPLSEVFPYFFMFDFFKIFAGLWYVPNFVSPVLKNKSARPGNKFIFAVGDHHTARYQLLTFLSDSSFSFKIDQFTSRRLIGLKAIEFRISFFEKANGMIHVDCVCQFKFRSVFWRWIFTLGFCKVLQRRLDAALLCTAKETGRFVKWKKAEKF